VGLQMAVVPRGIDHTVEPSAEFTALTVVPAFELATK